MVIRTVVVEDEDPTRSELCFLLEQLDDIDIVGQASNGVDAMEVFREQKPHLILLDIQMPGRTGFEIARELLIREIDTLIVFVTAYDHCAIEAFEVNTVDYLLKPVEAHRLQQSIERVKRRLTSRREALQERIDDQQLERVLQQVSQRQTQRERIVIKVGDRFQLVPSDDIIYASLVNDVIKVVAGSLTGTSNFRTLDELQSNLDHEVFWRVHRSHLVNINKVKEIVPWFSRNYILKMKDAETTEIPVSRPQTKRLREYLRL